MELEDIKTGKEISEIGEKVYIFPFVSIFLSLDPKQ